MGTSAHMAATYTVKQVADILGYSTNSIYTFLKEKRIKGVRVGKGRFRIPQAELDRLLQASKAPIAYSTQSTEQHFTASNATSRETYLPTQKLHQNGLESLQASVVRVDVPCLFDWFVSIASILLGFSMFLFTKTFEEYEIQRYIAWVWALRVTLLASGIGLLIADITGKTTTRWHRLFQVLLSLSYLGFAGILYAIGDTDGTVIYGFLAVVLLGSTVLSWKGVRSYLMYISGILILFPLTFLPNVSSSIIVPATWTALTTYGLFTVGVWIILMVAFVSLMWWAYSNSRRVFWLCVAVSAACLILLSLWYARNIYWGRSLFVLLTGVLCLFVPTWETLKFNYRNDRKVVFQTFGSLLLLFLAAEATIQILQANMLEYASTQLSDRVTYGKILVESSFDASQMTLESMAQNTGFIDAVAQKDNTVLNGMIRSVFEGTQKFRHVFVFLPDGTLVTRYPLVPTTTSTTFATSDFFIQATTRRKTYMNDSIEPDGQGTRKTVIVAVPIVDKKQELKGLLVGSVDIESLSFKLQEVASNTFGEYFTVIDQSARRVIHPDRNLLNTEVEDENTIRLGLAGKHGVREGYGSKGIRLLQAYDSIEKLSWGISVQAPMTSVLHTTVASSVVVFSLVLGSSIIAGIFLLTHRFRATIPDEEVTSERQDTS